MPKNIFFSYTGGKTQNFTVYQINNITSFIDGKKKTSRNSAKLIITAKSFTHTLFQTCEKCHTEAKKYIHLKNKLGLII